MSNTFDLSRLEQPSQRERLRLDGPDASSRPTKRAAGGQVAAASLISTRMRHFYLARTATFESGIDTAKTRAGGAERQHTQYRNLYSRLASEPAVKTTLNLSDTLLTDE
jgi:hypothetical protein